MTDRNRGGRIAPDGRPVTTSGVGSNSERTDLSRRDVPFLHGSDLQQGDVEALRQGQRIAPRQTQRPNPQPEVSGQQGQRQRGNIEPPDPIDFIASRAPGQVQVPEAGVGPAASKAATWLPILRQMVVGPGSSGLLASALIDQARRLRNLPQREATIIDMQDIDAGLEAMLDEGV